MLSASNSQCRSAAALLASGQALVAAVLDSKAEALRQVVGSSHCIGSSWGWCGGAALCGDAPGLSLGCSSCVAQALCCGHSGSLCSRGVVCHEHNTSELLLELLTYRCVQCWWCRYTHVTQFILAAHTMLVERAH
jgi:hypothetical protein